MACEILAHHGAQLGLIIDDEDTWLLIHED
jgi:hypothetical protein